MLRITKFLVTTTALMAAACSPESDNSATTPTAFSEAPQVIQTTSGTTGRPELGTFGIDLSNQDRSIRPGDDFFRYTNGRWLEEFQLAEDRDNYGTFDVLGDRADENIRTIIDDLTSMEPARGSIEQKISDYYLSYMDTAALNERGISPLQPQLARINAITSISALISAFGSAEIDNTASPIAFGVSADRIDPDAHQLSIAIGGIGLPDRDYYLEDTPRFVEIRNEYKNHIARMLGFAGVADSMRKAEAILNLETRIAEHIWPRSERRNRDLTYNSMSYADFVQAYPGMDWNLYFSAAGITTLPDLNVLYPSAMSPIINLISEIDIQDWKNYFSFHLISNSASLLSEEIDNENFSFYSTVLSGIPSQRPRWERSVARVAARSSLGEAVGQIYVQQHFPESAKQQMLALVENVRAALAQSIEELPWMSTETKREATLKLNAFRPKIAYPDEWEDLSAIAITRDDLFANARNIREFNYQDQLSRLGKPTNREEWGMTPQTVNAYYNSSFNEIVFPAAILQAPFFDPAADPAVNYGGIGAVIGHEMGHGFDDQGSKVDYSGVQRNWWTNVDRANFDRLTTALAEQYAGFEPVPGYNIDGRFTLGENIGDVGGLSLAYRAYKMFLAGEEAPVIDGLTGDQRFFLSWAQVWQRKYREDALIRRLTTDPHSPAEFRVNGVVRNFDEWYEAFDVQPTDALYLPPAERIRIW